MKLRKPNDLYNFLEHYFALQQYFTRFRKDTKQTWECLLQTFPRRSIGLLRCERYCNNFLTASEIARPSACPASCLVATPITFPISAGEAAPTCAIIAFRTVSSSSPLNCFGINTSSTAASANSFSASSGRLFCV